MAHEVVIVGGGLSGLCCALELYRNGVSFLLIEATDRVGGRVKTDQCDGFLLDRGFQVLLTAYPEAQRVLDYSALRLKPFYPGALVYDGSRFHRVADPWRKTRDSIKSILSPVGSLADKLRIAWLRRQVLDLSLENLMASEESTTQQRLEKLGFSPKIIDSFFQPFLGGVFLDADLTTSSRMLDFVFRMFSIGETAIPEKGMEAIPRQLLSMLPGDSIITDAKVKEIKTDSTELIVTLASGEKIETQTVVLATNGLDNLLSEKKKPKSRVVSCFYFVSELPPITEPILVLNGTKSGLVNNLCVPSNISPTPTGAALISATVLGDSKHTTEVEPQAVKSELRQWFGTQVENWKHLKTYHISHALPSAEQIPPQQLSYKYQEGIYLCGDYMESPSIQGAMVSGRKAAQAILGSRL